MEIQRAKIVVINVVITFLEGFAPAWYLSGNRVNAGALVGAGAAGLSAVWNLIVKPLIKSKTNLYK